MNPSFAAFIAVNNLLHDLATAVPLASGIAMWMILGQFQKNRNSETGILVMKMYRVISKIFIGSLIWITLGAIPRILTFTSYEWASASSDHNVAGLIAKHLTTFVVLVAGTFLWIALTRKMKRLAAAA